MFRLPAHRYVPGFSLERISPDFNNIDPLRRWLRSAPWAAQCGGGQLWRKVPVIVKVGWEQGCTQRVVERGGAGGVAQCSRRQVTPSFLVLRSWGSKKGDLT